MLFELFGAQPGVVEATAALGQEAGAALPLLSGGLGLIFLTLPYLVFFNLWPNWGATLYGEVRGATDFKRNILGMGTALLVTTLLGILLLFAIRKTIGWNFYVQSGAAWWNYAWGFTTTPPALPIWPYPALFASFLSSSRVLQFIVVALMSLWWFGWSGTVFLSSTRVIFAAAFDRLLPEKIAEVDERTGTPIYALLLMVVAFDSHFIPVRIQHCELQVAHAGIHAGHCSDLSRHDDCRDFAPLSQARTL